MSELKAIKTGVDYRPPKDSLMPVGPSVAGGMFMIAIKTMISLIVSAVGLYTIVHIVYIVGRLQWSAVALLLPLRPFACS